MIWVVGHTGMLGKAVKLYLLNMPCIISNIDICDYEEITNFTKAYKNIDWIINCAAYTDVDNAESQKDKAFKVNYEGVKNIQLIAQQYNSKIIHISTDYVYAGINNTFINEDEEPKPVNTYGASKLEGDNYLINNYDKYFIIRTAWLFGEYGKNFVNTMLHLMNTKKELNIINDQWGTPTNINDLVNAIYNIIINNSDKYGVYHFTNEGKTTWFGFATEIQKQGYINSLCSLDTVLNPVYTSEFPTRANRPQYTVLSKEKIKNTFNLKISPWQDALSRFIKRYDI